MNRESGTVLMSGLFLVTLLSVFLLLTGQGLAGGRHAGAADRASAKLTRRCRSSSQRR